MVNFLKYIAKITYALIYPIGLFTILIMFFCDFLSHLKFLIALGILIVHRPIIHKIIKHLEKKNLQEFDSPDWYWAIPNYFSKNGIITLEEMKSLQNVFIKEWNLDIANAKADFEIEKLGDVQKIADIFIRLTGYKGKIGKIDDFCGNASWYVCQIIIEYLNCRDNTAYIEEALHVQTS
ncbi:MAG: hypothetical protein LBQ87_08415 [Candidatus Fibromonas sp.]|jgi:hypothetical protein|nr:hypothetical protein [Candidatus Fibromonas sp.]